MGAYVCQLERPLACVKRFWLLSVPQLCCFKRGLICLKAGMFAFGLSVFATELPRTKQRAKRGHCCCNKMAANKLGKERTC